MVPIHQHIVMHLMKVAAALLGMKAVDLDPLVSVHSQCLETPPIADESGVALLIRKRSPRWINLGFLSPMSRDL